MKLPIGTLMAKLYPETPVSMTRFRDHFECALTILSKPKAGQLYRRFGVDQAQVVAGFRRLDRDVFNSLVPMTVEACVENFAAGGLLHNPLTIDFYFLCRLFTIDDVALRQVLVPSGRLPGDLPLYLCHREMEADLERLWEKPEFAAAPLLLWNDPVTPMDVVLGILEDHLGLVGEGATDLMMTVHHAGTARLPTAQGVDLARRINRESRLKGLPLLCAPQPSPPVRPSPARA